MHLFLEVNVQKSKVSIHENDPLSHLNKCKTFTALLTHLSLACWSSLQQYTKNALNIFFKMNQKKPSSSGIDRVAKND